MRSQLLSIMPSAVVLVTLHAVTSSRPGMSHE
jgi:hypothetical protein